VDDFIGGGRRGSSVPSIGGYVAPLDGAPYMDEEDKKGKVGCGLLRSFSCSIFFWEKQ
jgi:hypothetical protein